MTLPDQPTTGETRYIPMGGDGYSAPFAAYNVIGHSVTGAVGGGAAVLTCIMDPRYVSLISYVQIDNVQVASADADLQILLTGAQFGMPTQALSENVVAVSATVNVGTIRKLWKPEPVLLAGGGKRGNLQMFMLNVDADVYTMSVLVYLFNIRAREISPSGLLFWGRGSN